jgi:protein SCO1/2
MERTALLSATLAAAAYASALWLTHDFQVWTAEGARRLEVALQPVATPGAQVEGPALPARPLLRLLADGSAVTLVDFVYTRCQTVCLTLGNVYQQMQAQLQGRSLAERAAHPVQLLSISLDGQHDSVPVLQAYAARLGADPQLWRFVRVPDAQQFQRLLAAYQVVVVPDGRGDLEHNAALLLVDQQGRLVRVFDYADQQLALNYAQHLAGRSAP